KGGIMSGRHLPETGEPGSNVKAAEVLEIVAFEIVFGMRTRPHNAHIALDDIEELEQFVNAVFAQETSQAGDAWVVYDLEGSAVALIHMHQAVLALVGIDHHGAEFVATKLSALAPDTPRFIEHGAGRIELHGDSRQQQHRGRDHQRHHADEQVHNAFDKK